MIEVRYFCQQFPHLRPFEEFGHSFQELHCPNKLRCNCCGLTFGQLQALSTNEIKRRRVHSLVLCRYYLPHHFLNIQTG